ncbi:MAG: hypothetical protein J6Y36_06120 [Treponema sp.]|nr:hypothetical protein [Treponema sp.]
MKKFAIAALLTAFAAVAVFAQSKTYVIDLGDSTTGKTVSIVKNQYGPNHQNAVPPTFTKFFEADMPKPGDIVEVHYKLTSNKDLPALTFALIDNSESAKWWLEISNQYETIDPIKADQVVEGVIKFKVIATPVAAVTVQLMYDDKIVSKITLQKAGVKTGKK